MRVDVETAAPGEKGITAWFVRNPVAANLLMVLIMVTGALTVPGLRKEVFPTTDLNLINVSVAYPGAAPAEVEESICQRIEEEVQGISGIEKVTSIAAENGGAVTIEVMTGEDVSEVMEEVKNRVDSITSFPEDAERPIYSEPTNIRQVVYVAISGDVSEPTLKRLGERVRDDLLSTQTITLANLVSVRPYEISIEVAEDALRRWGLTFAEVADAVRRSSLDLPGGSVKTEAGEILLRAKGQAYRGRDFEDIVVLSRIDGSRVLLRDVATIVDGFADTELESRFDGRPAALVQIFRVGDQSAFDIADAVYGYIDRAAAEMPPGVTLTAWRDDSKFLRGRLELLLRSALSGLVLVFFVLALFLRFKLAAWVTVGIPVSFLGALALMPLADISINMISLFAFIVVLGIVVDDAIVVGENVYSHLSKGEDGPGAAVRGSKEVAVPVVFAVLTTIVAFCPMFDVAGNFRRIWMTIPFIVISCLLVSLVESKLVLPAHLAHLRVYREGERPHLFARLWLLVQTPFLAALDWFIRRVYRPSLELSLRWRYLTVASMVAVFVATIGFVGSGRLPFRFLPDLEGDNAVALLRMPLGTPQDITAAAVARIEATALDIRRELEASGQPGVVQHVLATVGQQPFAAEQRQNAGNLEAQIEGAHLGEVNVQLAPSEERTVTTEEIVRRWRDRVGVVPDAVELSFSSQVMTAGADIDLRLTSSNHDHLRAAADELKAELVKYAGVTEVADSFVAGKRELRLEVRDSAEPLGLTQAALARQVRQAFYGEEAQRVQRGREEVKVMVRYPAANRRSLADLEAMRLRTPDGAEVPFAVAAQASEDRGYATIQRTNRARKVNVTAKVDPLEGNAGEIQLQLEREFLPRLMAHYPGLSWDYEGQAQEQAETMASLARGYLVALVAIFALMAIPFRSYFQPLIVMTAIPFGIVGAVWGHVLMGMGLSIMSMFGLVALTGVVVNDSLVMVDFVNRARRRGETVVDAVLHAGPQRFRPILLTTLTTFAGLTPLLLERSVQAKFLIPMAISLGFGVLFATLVTLLLVPNLYVILGDIGRAMAPVRRWLRWVFAPGGSGTAPVTAADR